MTSLMLTVLLESSESTSKKVKNPVPQISKIDPKKCYLSILNIHKEPFRLRQENVETVEDWKRVYTKIFCEWDQAVTIIPTLYPPLVPSDNSHQNIGFFDRRVVHAQQDVIDLSAQNTHFPDAEVVAESTYVRPKMRIQSSRLQKVKCRIVEKSIEMIQHSGLLENVEENRC